ncbi:MAG: hypothetical protein A2W94_01460 [Bacteroidetes bacterium GWE2_42_42]|nr:MAG: hypothetical protein A2W94_01460 [Bacteroidetes bacterium GWE2_42_42]
MVIMFVPFQLFGVICAILGVLAIICFWVLSFFRYPKRTLPEASPESVFSSADGKVVVIEKIKTDRFPEGEAIQISVFMSIYSVHLNYVPITGTITSVEHRNGLHLMAIKPKASLENEQSETVILTEQGKQIIVRQIAGAAARRVITFLEPDQKVKAGDELGFIRFGSRVDHIIPVSSIIKVKTGEKVTGCKSILAELK